KATQKLCVALTGLSLAAAAAGLLAAVARLPGAVGLMLGAAAGVAAVVSINRAFFAFLLHRKGWRFAGAAIPLQLVYYCCCGLSVVIAMTHWNVGRIRRLFARPDKAVVPPPHLAIDRGEDSRMRPRRRRLLRRAAEDRPIQEKTSS
ncbi:MAG: hypothetical protein ACYC61_16835, partial [Isosphaeraceae bacterium]